jgi:uncharacterized protein (TIGR03382 family)
MRRLAASIAMLLPVLSLALAPDDGGPLTILPITINANGGDQFDPHVSGDLAAYTDDANINYYDFFGGTHGQVTPLVDHTDRLSDVSNGNIVFSRESTLLGSSSIMVFNVGSTNTTEVAPGGFPLRTSGAIGSDTVAYIDLALASGGELAIADLNAPATATRVTNDTRADSQPQVAPLGDLVVYRSCSGGASTCEIRQTGWNGSSWVVTNLTANSDSDENPDSDGVIVVYDSTRGGERDVYWQSVGGDAEKVLNLAGAQRNPSVSAGVIAFESVAPLATAADLYVYEVATNRLFRVTNTAADETLNDVYVLPDGKVRMVWTSGSAFDRDVHGATFELPGVTPPTCGEVTVVASITYHPHAWQDFTSDVPNTSFAVPATLPVIEGNAGNGHVWLSFRQDGGDETKCLYQGAETAYLFHHCTVGSVVAGTTVVADHVTVRVQNADAHHAKTTIGTRLGTPCAPPGPAPQVSTGEDAADALGCSSSGGSFAFGALALVMLALLMPRRAAVPVRSRRSNR